MSDAYRIRNVCDVRKLATCATCHALGMHAVDLLLVAFKADTRGRKRDKVYAHAKCLSTDALLSLPIDELGNVRINDVSPEVLQLVLKQLKEARS